MQNPYDNTEVLLGGRYGIVFLAVVVFLLFGGIWTYELLQGRDHAAVSAENNNANLVRIIEEANNRTLQAIDLTLTNLAVCVRSKQWRDGYDKSRYFQTLLAEAPQIREVAFADKSGRIVAISRSQKPAFWSVETESYFQNAKKARLPQLVISSPRAGRLLGDVSQNGQWHLVAARAVLDDDGMFQGVALAVINPGFFQEQFNALDVGEHGFVALYRYDGELLVRSGPGNLDERTVNSINSSIFASHLPRREWGTFLEVLPKGPRDAFILSYRATSRWPVLVVVGVDREEVLLPWLRDAWDFTILMGGSLLVLAGLTYVVFQQRVRQEVMAQKLFEAHHDDLTGIPALRLSLDRLSNALARAKREKDLLGVFFVDLDGFKDVNDTCGHEAGDHVLKTTAARLQASVREMDTVGRLGGDEFLIFFPKIEVPGAVDKIAASVLSALRKPIEWQGKSLQVSASVGIALYPRDGRDAEQLIKRADDAMYIAKKRGKNQFAHANSGQF